MSKKLTIILSIIVSAIVSIGAIFTTNTGALGVATPTTNLDSLAIGTGGLTVAGETDLNGSIVAGASGTTLSNLKFGTCTIYAYATTIAATSTAQVDCQGGAAALTAISGIQSGDKIFVTLASTTAYTTQGGLVLEHAAASTTAGYITLKIFNATGGTFTWASTASSSISYLDLR